jgi:hypothetical protein
MHPRAFARQLGTTRKDSSGSFDGDEAVGSLFPGTLELDRKRAGWSVGRAAWDFGVSAREDRELEAGTPIAELRDLGPDLKALRLAAELVGRRF